MALLAKRLVTRRLALYLTLASILGLSLFGIYGNTPPAIGQQADRISVVKAQFDAINAGDVEGATSQFASNAVWVAGRGQEACSLPTPCTDVAGIRKQIQGNVDVHSCYKLLWLQVSGAVVTGERQVTQDTNLANGVDHILVDFIAVVPQDKITYIAHVQNVADPATALNQAITAGTQPAGTPISGPATPCGPA